MDSICDIELPEADDYDVSMLQATRLNDAAMFIFNEERYGTAAPASMLRRALALQPGLSRIWSPLGLVLWRENKIEEAEACLRRAVDLDPYVASGHGNLGVFLGALNR